MRREPASLRANSFRTKMLVVIIVSASFVVVLTSLAVVPLGTEEPGHPLPLVGVGLEFAIAAAEVRAAEKEDAAKNECPPELPPPGDMAHGGGHIVCAVQLPPLAGASREALVERAEMLLEGEESAFPFNSEVGYNISEVDADNIDKAIRSRAKPGEKMPWCTPSTYDGHSVSHIAEQLLPGAPGEISAGDELVDLGAGIGKVLAVAALVTNASARGIELSVSRHAAGCKVLNQLVSTLAAEPGLAATHPGSARRCPTSRRIELWRGDLLSPPKALLRPPSLPSNILQFFAYANCYPYGVLAQMMELVASNAHGCIRLLTTKAPVSLSKLQQGLRRGRGTGLYSSYTRDGDTCQSRDATKI